MYFGGKKKYSKEYKGERIKEKGKSDEVWLSTLDSPTRR